MINELLTYTVLVSLTSAFIVLFLGKTGIREYMQVYAPKLIAEMASCDFCLCFWVAVTLSVPLSIITMNFLCIFIPIFSTPISRHIL